MRSKPAAVRALLSLTAAIVLALAGTAIAHHGDWFGHDGPAGTVASFDPSSGALTIDLANGGSVSGTVTRWTWIDCGDDRGWHRGRRFFHGSGDGGHEWDHHHSHCSTDDLTSGAVVDDAALSLRDGGAFFWKVDLEGEDEGEGGSGGT
jgi:hypothetical protein